MAQINKVVKQAVDWIKAQQLAPQPREVVSVGVLPPSAFPHVAVAVLEERQSAVPGSFSATLTITVSHASGRPAEAQSAACDLAHQLRRALNRSHGLGGAVKSLVVAGIRHGAELLSGAEPRVLSKAELLVSVSYDEARL